MAYIQPLMQNEYLHRQMTYDDSDYHFHSSWGSRCNNVQNYTGKFTLSKRTILTRDKNFSCDLIRRCRRLFPAEVCGTEMSLDTTLTSRHKCGLQPRELDPALAFPYIARFQKEDDLQRSLTGNVFCVCVCVCCKLYVYKKKTQPWTVIKSNTRTRLRHYNAALKHSVSNVKLQKLKHERENRNRQRKHANEIEVIKVTRSFLILAGFLFRL